ncbi:MAG: hypothetical protein AAF844_22400 [Pseudomonadota bacterium]
MRNIILGALALTIAGIAVAPEADAKRKRGGRGDNAVSQSQASVQVEWARARAVGGYGNPFSAIVDAFTGRERPERPGQVQRVITPQEALDIRKGSVLELF